MILPNDVARCVGKRYDYPHEMCPLREKCMRFRAYEYEVLSDEGEERIVSVFYPSRIGDDCDLIMEVRDEKNGV
jgi:hypothetical protein